LRHATGNLDFYTVQAGTNIKLHTANTLALTVDSSQNATFAGNITSDSGGATTTLQIDSDTESSIKFNDHGGSAKAYRIGTNISSNDGRLEIRDDTAGAERFRIATDGAATFAGTVSDSKGDLRNIPVNAQSSSATYNPSTSDIGKCIVASGSTSTIEVSGGAGFAAGNAITIINENSSDLNITAASSMSIRNSATATAGNKKLGQYGMATIFFTGSTTGYISGAGLTDA